ncbi:antibiotic biosynthesis monooxygenase [Aeromicrobium sp. YIM 150415]|uniref:Antibiotic biosynthesis monooxygenase n=1 Tax=Aeromicrobium piscarium TaxID=2590901 RepID=A0A554S9Z7_9ACTN|nr:MULTISPECIES: putative quinol monooxygenase [Aeromicrobium]MBM9464248.1 antibiotic biosynthesis monooxygenase [Aeromicrobium sp. YIM 150415]TSD63149.1 antibiotic biosynthesis monooxygenase [Aeromicrobium piscarium]
MIFIAVKFTVKPEWSERWIEHVTPFTEATRAEPGNLWFDWSRSVEDPNVFVLLEAFADGDAGSEHVQSEHFAQAMRDLPPALVRTPQIISEQIEATDWNLMGEMTVE